MKLLESKKYNIDLIKAINNSNLSLLEGKSFFITGGLGLICSTIIDVLLTYGKTSKIYVGARNKNKFDERFEETDKIVYVHYDALSKLNFDVVPDYIICGAGLSSPELYIQKPVETILSNFIGLQNLLEFSKNNKIKRLLYISSSEVYGKKTTYEPFKEGEYGEVNIDDIRSSYPIAKQASELLCKSYFAEYNVDTVIARPGHIYGPSAKKNDKRISSDFANKAAKGENLVMKSTGSQKRSYCYSIDCAIQILTILQKGKSAESYNVGHDEVTTIREMSETIAKTGGCKLIFNTPNNIDKASFNPMNNSSLDNSKTKKLGYKDTFTTEEGLIHTVNILKEMAVDMSSQN